MAGIATWEFEGDAVFDGRNAFAEASPRMPRQLTSGTLELAFTCHDIVDSVVVGNGIPEINPGTFEVTVTAEGAIGVACSNGGVEPVRAATPSGFAVEGERIQVTLSWGSVNRFSVVNVSRLEDDPDGMGMGFSASLPLWARIRLLPGALLTFGASHRGNPPYFHGAIHFVTLSDSADAPSIAPPTATVHRFNEHRTAPVRPRRVTVGHPRSMPGVQGTGPSEGPVRSGVFVATATGERPIEDLRVGDEILTRDHGLQPLRWIDHVSLDWSSLRRRPHLRPVVIRKGALGQGLPEADLALPPHHRLVSRQIDREVLLSARTLSEAEGVYQAEALGVTYTHLQFDHSALVLRNGVWVEAFNPADAAGGGSFASQRAELFELFPALRVVVFGLTGQKVD